MCEATLETIYEDDDTEEQQQDLGEEGEEGNSEEEQEKEEEEEEEQEDDEHASPTFRKSLLELKSNNHRYSLACLTIQVFRFQSTDSGSWLS